MLRKLMALFSSETPLKALVLEARDESLQYPDRVVHVSLGKLARYRVDAHFRNTYYRAIENTIEAFLAHYKLDRSRFRITRTYALDSDFDERILTDLAIAVHPYGWPEDGDIFVRVNSGADTEDHCPIQNP